MTIIDILIRIGLAILIGGAVGWERESCDRPAGFRTHTIVCLSAAVVMMTGIFVMKTYMDVTVVAPAYIAAAVLSGIGFLGAGTILRSGTKVKGLTTAASLWSVAGLGLAVGSGFYLGAVFGAIIVILTLTILEGVAKKFALGSKRFHSHLTFTCKNPETAIKNIVRALAEHDIYLKITSIYGDEHGVYKLEGRMEASKIGRHINFMYVATLIHRIEDIETIKLSEY
jgi:putative Mg2+ transporter-C (MgtC) family protein